MKYDNQDDPIDWSGFDEKPHKVRRVAGCGLMGALAIIILIAALVGLIVAIAHAGDVLSAFTTTEGTDTSSLSAPYLWGSVLAVSLLSFIPAAFGISYAANPRFTLAVPVIVLGVLGLAVAPLLQVLATVVSSSGFTLDFGMWMLLELPTVLYLVLGIVIGRRAPRAQSGRASKEDLWKDENIW